MIGEQDLINKYFQRSLKESGVGIGDDAAVLAIGEERLFVSVDTMVEGTHFKLGDDPNDIGYKALATALSDLAAMGATPRWALLCLTLPSSDENWLKQFSDGFFAVAGHYGVELIGGDTTRGALSISVQVIGTSQTGCMLRSTAVVGQGIYVTGYVGGGGLVNLRTEQMSQYNTELFEQCMLRYKRPDPRVRQAQCISRYAQCAIDISDGILLDLSRVLVASGIGASVGLKELPVPDSFYDCCRDSESVIDVLAFGEDYELLFVMDDKHLPALEREIVESPITITRIATAESKQGLRCTYDGASLNLPKNLGFDHFASA